MGLLHDRSIDWRRWGTSDKLILLVAGPEVEATEEEELLEIVHHSVGTGTRGSAELNAGQHLIVGEVTGLLQTIHRG